MLCEWGTFTGREPPEHRERKSNLFCLPFFCFNLGGGGAHSQEGNHLNTGTKKQLFVETSFVFK